MHLLVCWYRRRSCIGDNPSPSAAGRSPYGSPQYRLSLPLAAINKIEAQFIIWQADGISSLGEAYKLSEEWQDEGEPGQNCRQQVWPVGSQAVSNCELCTHPCKAPACTHQPGGCTYQMQPFTGAIHTRSYMGSLGCLHICGSPSCIIHSTAKGRSWLRSRSAFTCR